MTQPHRPRSAEVSLATGVTRDSAALVHICSTGSLSLIAGWCHRVKTGCKHSRRIPMQYRDDCGSAECPSESPNCRGAACKNIKKLPAAIDPLQCDDASLNKVNLSCFRVLLPIPTGCSDFSKKQRQQKRSKQKNISNPYMENNTERNQMTKAYEIKSMQWLKYKNSYFLCMMCLKINVFF